MISRRFDQLTTGQFHDLARLRSEVFVVEQDCVYLDLDGRDIDAEHHWVESDGTIVAAARTLTDPDGAVRIGRVVTSPGARGAGSASRVMAVLVERYGATDLVLEAQSHLAEWYGRFGFEVVGDEYLEDDIPHVPMRRAAR